MEKSDNIGNQQEVRVRVRFPRNNQILGLIEQRVGGSRMLVKCADGKTRNCRVPGRLKRALWLREGDYVIVEPWEFDNDKGDIVFKYNLNDIPVLKSKGMLNGIEDSF
ncbi:MAG: translation initiation factor eIF-1A [Candidatus Pacearchaeota archaeon]